MDYDALDEVHYAIHPGLFPIGLVDVIFISVISYLNHSPFFVAELKIIEVDEEDILNSNMHIS
jgi:hypothetical protein